MPEKAETISARGIEDYLISKKVNGDARKVRSWLEAFYLKNREAILATIGNNRKEIAQLFGRYNLERIEDAIGKPTNGKVVQKTIKLIAEAPKSDETRKVLNFWKQKQERDGNVPKFKGPYEQQLYQLIRANPQHAEVKKLWEKWSKKEQSILERLEDPYEKNAELITALKEKGPEDNKTMEYLNEWLEEQERLANQAADRNEGAITLNLNRARLYLAAGFEEYADENFKDAQELARQLYRDFLSFLISCQKGLDLSLQRNSEFS